MALSRGHIKQSPDLCPLIYYLNQAVPLDRSDFAADSLQIRGPIKGALQTNISGSGVSALALFY